MKRNMIFKRPDKYAQMSNRGVKKKINIRDVSYIYRIPLSTLRRWGAERRFPLFKVSNRILVNPEQFERWIESGGASHDSKP